MIFSSSSFTRLRARERAMRTLCSVEPVISAIVSMSRPSISRRCITSLSRGGSVSTRCRASAQVSLRSTVSYVRVSIERSAAVMSTFGAERRRVPPRAYAVDAEVAHARHDKRPEARHADEDTPPPQPLVEVLYGILGGVAIPQQGYGIAICRILDCDKLAVQFFTIHL